MKTQFLWRVLAAGAMAATWIDSAQANEGQFTRFHVSFDVPWMAFIVFGFVILVPVVLMAVLSLKNMNKNDEAQTNSKD